MEGTMNSYGKLAGVGLLGLVIGGTLSWGNMFTRLQPAMQRAAQAETARDEATRAAKTLEGQLKEAQQAAEKLQSASKAAEQALKEAKDQLAGALSAKQAAERAADGLKTQLAEATTAKQAAEQALAEAKKAAAPTQ
jgi:chromosome segregation ATPase